MTLTFVIIVYEFVLYESHHLQTYLQVCVWIETSQSNDPILVYAQEHITYRHTDMVTMIGLIELVSTCNVSCQAAILYTFEATTTKDK